jgi:hypothetical protein
MQRYVLTDARKPNGPSQETMTLEEAKAHRQLLIGMGLLIEGREPNYHLSNDLQRTHDVHEPIDQPDGTRPLPSLATQWRLDWARRMQQCK